MMTSKKKRALIIAIALIILVCLLALLLLRPPASPPISKPTSPLTYTLTIIETTGGTTDPVPGSYTYSNGSIVTVDAVAFTGYVFDYWNLDGSEVVGSPSINVTMNANHTLRAVFALVTHTLTISTTTGGTTSPAPGDHIYAYGMEVQVNATANTGYVFDHWELDSSDVGSAVHYVVTMNTDHTLHAVFKPLYTLTITTTAGGTTDPEPGNHQFLEGTVVNVTAIPETNFILDYWELDGVNQGASNPIGVTMNANHTLLAVFQPLYTLTITCTTGGTTDPSPNTYQHKEGTVVEVTAIANAGYVFDHWELDSANVGSDNPIGVTMDANHTLHVVFTQVTYTLTISVTGKGTTNPAKGSHVYDSGSTATVSATADQGWYFDHWILDGENAGSTIPINVLMDSNHDLEAVFTQINYTLTITTTTGGTTSPAPGNHVYPSGTNVLVTATPQSGYNFDHWELDGLNVGSTNPYTVTMNANHTLHAVSKEIPPPPPVGGYAIPIDKHHLLAPKIDLIPGISLTFVLLAVMAVTTMLIRRRNKTLKWGR
jgi:hypothetical protein